MTSTKPLLVYGQDNGDCRLYNMTLEQFEKLEAEDDGSGAFWDTVDKFQIKVSNSECGYVPDYVVKLAEIYGFDVESI